MTISMFGIDEIDYLCEECSPYRWVKLQRRPRAKPKPNLEFSPENFPGPNDTLF